jgi:hypothetical protein
MRRQIAEEQRWPSAGIKIFVAVRITACRAGDAVTSRWQPLLVVNRFALLGKRTGDFDRSGLYIRGFGQILVKQAFFADRIAESGLHDR